VRQIAEREGVSPSSVFRVPKTNSSFLTVPSPSPAAEREGVSARTVFNVQKGNSFFFAVPSPPPAAEHVRN
jgi:hypothetical protein